MKNVFLILLFSINCFATSSFIGIPFVPPSTNGNCLVSNGTQWTSSTCGSAGAITGSGTTGAFSVFTSSSAIGSGQWTQGSNGEFEYTGSAKGTKDIALIAMNGTNTGLFLDATFGRPSVTIGGTLVAAFGGSPEFFVYDGFGTTNGMGLRALGGSAKIQGYGALDTLEWRSFSGATSSQLLLNDSSGATQVQLIGSYNTNASQPAHVFFGGGQTDQVDAMMLARRGLCLGGAVDTCNALTVVQRANHSNIGGTTSANATTSITGVSTNFKSDYGDGDLVSLSSAPTVYARINSITDDTHMVVASALGDGSPGQTFNKQQAMLSIQTPAHAAVDMEMSPLGQLGFSSANGNVGTATCNGTTAVVVSDTIVTANTKIFYAPNAAVLTAPWTSARVAGTSFSMKCGAGDTATVDYWLVEPI